MSVCWEEELEQEQAKGLQNRTGTALIPAIATTSDTGGTGRILERFEISIFEVWAEDATRQDASSLMFAFGSLLKLAGKFARLYLEAKKRIKKRD